MKKILPFICTMFISFSAWGVTCDAGYYLPDGADECVICPAGKYSEAGASSCSNVSAGYFCSGGCTTATPTSDEDCLTGNTCGQCLTDSVTGRQAYSYAGAASCSVCPEVTGDLAGRVSGYTGWWSGDIHKSISGCMARFYDDDPDASYKTNCYYSATDGTYGGANSSCEILLSYVEACAAGKYNTITSTSEWISSYSRCKGVDCMKGKVCTDTTAGYYSPEGKLNQTACPAGTYSATAGAAACSYASPGYYATGCTDGTACTGQSQCTGTTYCANGMQYSCPTGYTENTTDGKSSVTQCQTTCPAGNYIASGTYTQLEYLESTNTQYINTGVIATLNTGAYLKVALTEIKDENTFFGATNAQAYLNGSPFSIDVMSTSRVVMPHGGVGTSSYARNNIQKTIKANQIYEYKLNYLNNGKASIDSTEVSLGNSTTMTNKPLYLFWLNNNFGGLTGYMVYAKIYEVIWTEGTEVSNHYIPVRRNSDSVLGMLDLVSGQFLTNAGTGTFVAGPDVAQIGGTCSASSAGYYATAKTIGYGTPAPQTACPLNTYSASGAASCTACATGTFAPTASPVCYPHILHVGNDVVYVRSTKLTMPSLNIDIDRDGVADFFVNMTTVRTKMNKDSEHYFHAQWENNDYYICDDTTCPQ